ncbi:MAG: lysophospholipid acyltransferase family protein [Pseudomonadota bacterium]
MRSIVFNVFFLAFTFVIALRVWWLARRKDRDAMHRTLRYWGETTLRAVDVLLDGKIDVRGRENIPTEGDVLFVSKHQSELDVVLLAALMPHCGAVAMAELTKYPFFGTILTTLGIVLIPVDQGPQNRTEFAIEGTAQTFAEGRPMIIYPEGTLMELGARERYRRGAGNIYARLNPTVVPVATSVGTIWPRREWRKNPGQRGAIQFLEPIAPGMAPEAFMEEVETRIEAATIELIREHASGDMLSVAEARYADAEARRAEQKAA